MRARKKISVSSSASREEVTLSLFPPRARACVIIPLAIITRRARRIVPGNKRNCRVSFSLPPWGNGRLFSTYGAVKFIRGRGIEDDDDDDDDDGVRVEMALGFRDREREREFDDCEEVN